MVPKQYASAEKENEPTNEDEDDSDSDWWSHLDEEEKMMSRGL